MGGANQIILLQDFITPATNSRASVFFRSALLLKSLHITGMHSFIVAHIGKILGA
jgi:hypothetical protein